MNLGVVFACRPKYIYDFSNWSVGVVVPFYNACCNLVAGFGVLDHVHRNDYVGSQELAVGDKVSKIAVYFQSAYEYLFFPFNDAGDDGFGFAASAVCAYVHFNLVAIQRMHRISFGHEDSVAFSVFKNYRVLSVAASAECAYCIIVRLFLRLEFSRSSLGENTR